MKIQNIFLDKSQAPPPLPQDNQMISPLYHMRTTKAQISLRIREVWSVPLLFAA